MAQWLDGWAKANEMSLSPGVFSLSLRHSERTWFKMTRFQCRDSRSVNHKIPFSYKLPILAEAETELLWWVNGVTLKSILVSSALFCSISSPAATPPIQTSSFASPRNSLITHWFITLLLWKWSAECAHDVRLTLYDLIEMYNTKVFSLSRNPTLCFGFSCSFMVCFDKWNPIHNIFGVWNWSIILRKCFITLFEWNWKSLTEFHYYRGVAYRMPGPAGPSRAERAKTIPLAIRRYVLDYKYKVSGVFIKWHLIENW